MKKEPRAKATTQRRGQSDRVLLLGQMAAGIVHDAGNQLMMIQGALGMAQRAALEPEARRIMLAAQEAATTVGELLQEVLTFIRPQKKQTEEVIYADDEIERLMPLLRSSMGDGIAINDELDAENARVCIDPVQLQNVILNLLINARNAMGGVGKIWLRTEECSQEMGDAWMLTVEDNGPGIPEGKLESIFEPYYTHSVQGHGLGLMRCRMLAEQAGGKLRAEEHEGGALFRLLLPTCEKAAQRWEEPVIVTGEGFVGIALSSGRSSILTGMIRAMGYTPVEVGEEKMQLALLDETTATDDLLSQLPPACPVLVMCRSDAVIKDPALRVRLLPRPFTMAELSVLIAAHMTGKE